MKTYSPTGFQLREELEATNEAACALLRRAGFFTWGHDSWCHDLSGIGCVTTAEALDILGADDEIGAILSKCGGRAS